MKLFVESRVLFHLLLMSVLALIQACGESKNANTSSWDDQALWSGAVDNVLTFFDKNAWDEASGSYASEIGENGALVADVREPVPLGRMIYANAAAPEKYRNLDRARKSADFLLAHMVETDKYGMRFLSSVNKQGTPISSGRSYVFIFEQAYPITGLVALYKADPVANADLLPIIRSAAESFWNRFRDEADGGLFYYYNFVKDDHSNDAGEVHKSYQSTVYPVSSFMLALREVDPGNREKYDLWINTLLEIATSKIVEQKKQVVTGWLYERFASDFSVDPSYVMSEAGHITQLSWVLSEALAEGIVTDPKKQESYRRISRALLEKFLEHDGISEATGCVYDAFDRTTGLPLRDQAERATTAWWSNLEAIIAYSKALCQGDFTGSEGQVKSVLNGLTACYFDRFVDRSNGGEYFRIDAESGEVVDPTKGNGGKSGYHLMEAYQHLFPNG